MLFYYDNIGNTNWVTHIRKHVYENGYGYVWENRKFHILKCFYLSIQIGWNVNMYNTGEQDVV